MQLDAGEVQRDLSVKHGDDSSLLVRFYFNAIEENHYVKINVPGDTKTQWDRPVREEDKQRFSKQWQAYEAKLDQFGTDTLIDEAPFLDPGRVNNYKKFNVFTIKQLANLVDGMANNIGMGTREDVKKARAWMAAQSAKATEEKLLKELDSRDEIILQQGEQIKELSAKLENFISSQPAPKKRAKRKAKAST
jgi:hypothetical protein